MKELYVIFNKNTGSPVGGAGIINKELDLKNLDGSTITENISNILSKDTSLDVLYLPKQLVPANLDELIVYNGQLVKQSKAQLLQKKNAEVKDTLITMYMKKRSESEAWSELEPTEASEVLANLSSYKDSLRTSYADIKVAFLALSDYQEIIDYQWQSLLPVEPDV